MQEKTTRKIYDLQSAVYDKTFGRLVTRRIAGAIQHMRILPGDNVLDLGIGTGNALQFYPPHATIFGVDLSAGMLKKALAKLAATQMTNVRLIQTNALQLPFADSTFDHIFISHVISVVSDPAVVVREAQRVCKPGARIVILNHFQSTNRVIATIEKWLCPLCTRLGWRSDLALMDLVNETDLEIDYRYKLESVDLWETVVTTNTKSALQKIALA